MPKLSVILDTRRKKKNFKYPLKIRVHFKSSSFYILLNIDIKKQEWNTEKANVNTVHPNYKRIQINVRKRLLELEELILSLSSEELNYFSPAQLKALLTRKVEPSITLTTYAYKHVELLEKTNRVGNANAYRQAINRLHKFTGKENIEFSEVNYNFLQRFEEQLLINGRKINTIACYLRHIRALYNKARNEDIIPNAIYPFNKYKIKTEATINRSLNIEELMLIWIYRPEVNSRVYFAHKVFMLIFTLIGINFTDLALLTQENIVNGRIIYKRKKTKKVYSIKLTPLALLIFEEFKGSHSKFLLPILPEEDLDPIKLKGALQQCLKVQNKYLKRIGEHLELPLKLTTYVARYSWATNAKKMGYSNEEIAEALGHSYGNKVTNIYLENYDKEVVDKMNIELCKVLPL